MSQNIVKFLVRRGSNSDRLMTVLQEGELGFTTDIDSRRLFVGDGITLGGCPVASRFYCISDWSSGSSTMAYVQLNDMLFVRSENSLYAFVDGGSPSLSANYLKIGQS